MRFAIVVTGPAYGTQQASSAFQFAQALIAEGHELSTERTLLGDGVGLLAMAEPLVAEQHEDTTNNQHDSNDRDAAEQTK